jgi:TfoX/Sxy family transcriptional regulator of competence genes
MEKYLIVYGVLWRMQWEKPSRELTDLLTETIGSLDAQKKSMFGSTCYFAGGNMFTGVHESHIFLRLSEKDRREMKELFGDTMQFEPIRGRPMREYVTLSPRLYGDTSAFKFWIGRSMEYARSLPPKAAKVKKVEK